MTYVDTIKEQLRARVAPLRQAWDQRPQREQQMLAAGGVLVLITLLYLLIWEPIQNARAAAENDLSDARSTAQLIERAAAIRPATRPGATVNRERSLLAQVDQATRSNTLGKAPERLQPDGDDAVRVWLEDVQLDALLRWIAEIEQRGLKVATADIERREAGLANARLQIERAS